MKDLNKLHVLAKGEMGFFKFIVKPLWVLLNKFVDNDLKEQI